MGEGPEPVGAGVPLVDLVLEDVKVVGGCYGDDVFMGVPRRVEDFLAEVQAVHTDLILATLAANAHLEKRQIVMYVTGQFPPEYTDNTVFVGLLCVDFKC